MQEPQPQLLIDPLDPNLILFLSVDIVGSTSFKARDSNRRSEGNPEHEWIQVFSNFYEDFDKEFRLNPALRQRLRIWKMLGDELLYFFQVKAIDEVIEVLGSFEKAVKFHRENEKYRAIGLSLKGTAWTGNFPVIDAVIEKPMQDFIGPSIDAGFRVSKFSSPTAFCLTADLTYIISDVCIKHKEGRLAIQSEYLASLRSRIFYLGSEPLKGVIRDRPYPVFYLFQGGDADRKLLEVVQHTPPSTESVKDYLEAFSRQVGSELTFCLPYLADAANNALYGSIPESHTKLSSGYRAKASDGPWPPYEPAGSVKGPDQADRLDDKLPDELQTLLKSPRPNPPKEG